MTLERSEIDMQNAVGMRQEETPETYSTLELAVLSEIAGHDITAPVTLLDLRQLVGDHRRFFATERQIKAAVARLRDSGQPIGAHRGKLHGYFWCSDIASLEVAARPMLAQAFAMLRTARKLLGPRRLKELAGQQQFDSLFEDISL